MIHHFEMMPVPASTGSAIVVPSIGTVLWMHAFTFTAVSVPLPVQEHFLQSDMQIRLLVADFVGCPFTIETGIK